MTYSVVTYSYEDILHQIIKALVLRHVDDNADAWVTTESFESVTIEISNTELRRASNELILDVQIHDHISPETRHVTVTAARNEDEVTRNRGA